MFGFGFKGPEWPLHHGPESIPSVADAQFVVPIVLLDYGTGAVMGVPAHDDRDFEFAHAFGLPVARVIEEAGVPGDVPMQAAYLGEGRLIASDDFTEMRSPRCHRWRWSFCK